MNTNQEFKDRVFRNKELDQGFILRANDEVARFLRDVIHKP